MKPGYLGLLVMVPMLSFCGSHSSPPSEPAAPQKPINDSVKKDELADILRVNDPEIAKLIKDRPELTAVTREFGQTTIALSSLPIKSGLEISSAVPWSSWWYPKNSDFLFKESEPASFIERFWTAIQPAKAPVSTLAKYDMLHGTKAAEFARKKFDPKANSWEGLCDAWSLAAVLSPEPKHPVTVSVGGVNVEFSVADLKALLLMTYEAVDDSEVKYYGQKFTGNSEGWVYIDVFPEQFHRLLEVELFGNKRPFILDHDPGVEVWTNPVFKANYAISAMPNQPNAVFVRTWVYAAEVSLETDKNFVGTREVVREYDYVLTGDITPDNTLVVNSGYWVAGPDGVDSRKDHPDYLIRIVDGSKVERKSWNPEINVKAVDELVERSY